MPSRAVTEEASVEKPTRFRHTWAVSRSAMSRDSPFVDDSSQFWHTSVPDGVPRIGEADGCAAGSGAGERHAEDRSMFRKALLSALMVGATLVAAPTVLGAVGGHRIGDAPFAHRSIATHGWQAGPILGAGRLRIGVPVGSSLTISNDGASSARCRLSARVAGDRAFASQLRIVVTRRSDRAVVFAGPVTGLQVADLGSFRAHAAQAFDLRVTLVSTGSTASDNALEGRSASVDLGWTATQA